MPGNRLRVGSSCGEQPLKSLPASSWENELHFRQQQLTLGGLCLPSHISALRTIQKAEQHAAPPQRKQTWLSGHPSLPISGSTRALSPFSLLRKLWQDPSQLSCWGL